MSVASAMVRMGEGFMIDDLGFMIGSWVRGSLFRGL